MKKIAILFFVLSLLILPSLSIASTPVENYNASIEAGDIVGAAQAEEDINAMDSSGVIAAGTMDGIENASKNIAAAKIKLIGDGKTLVAIKSLEKMPIIGAANIVEQMLQQNVLMSVGALREIAIRDASKTAELLLAISPYRAAEALREWHITWNPRPSPGPNPWDPPCNYVPLSATFSSMISTDVAGSYEIMTLLYDMDPNTLKIMMTDMVYKVGGSSVASLCVTWWLNNPVEVLEAMLEVKMLLGINYIATYNTFCDAVREMNVEAYDAFRDISPSPEPEMP